MELILFILLLNEKMQIWLELFWKREQILITKEEMTGVLFILQSMSVSSPVLRLLTLDFRSEMQLLCRCCWMLEQKIFRFFTPTNTLSKELELQNRWRKLILQSPRSSSATPNYRQNQKQFLTFNRWVESSSQLSCSSHGFTTQMSHSFAPTVFHGQVTCYCCKESIWGFLRASGFQCTGWEQLFVCVNMTSACAMTVHKKCKSKASDSCPAT